MKWPEIIRGLTGMTQQEYNILEYESGMEFIEMMEEDNPALLKELKLSNQYWVWWRRQFWRLGREFINRNGLEMCLSTSKNRLKEKLIDYCSIVKVSDYGVTSYGYLVTNFQGKQQKDNQISAENANDSNRHDGQEGR